MPTLNFHLADGGGSPLVAQAVTFDTVGEPLAVTAGVVRSRSRVTATTDEDGDGIRILSGGAWRMRWTLGNIINEIVFTMPPSGGPYDLTDLMFYRPTDGGGGSGTGDGLVWFDDIAQMLATESGTWSEGRTLNSYGESPSIITAWNHLLLTDPAADGLTANEDSILETDDGLGLCVRLWIAS